MVYKNVYISTLNQKTFLIFTDCLFIRWKSIIFFGPFSPNNLFNHGRMVLKFKIYRILSIYLKKRCETKTFDKNCEVFCAELNYNRYISEANKL